MSDSGVTTRIWSDFWAGKNRVYITERYRQLHYATLAADVLSVLPPESASIVMLDYGCGEALGSDAIAQRIGRLDLFDPSPYVRTQLERRIAGYAKIRVLDAPARQSAGAGGHDVILVYSVVQYMSEPEFRDLLADCRRWLRPGGLLILGDVIPRSVTEIADALSLLRTAARHGFLGSAVFGFIAALSSDYGRVRARAGIARYEEHEVLALLESSRFSAERRPANFGLNQNRMTFLARKPRETC